MVALGIVVLGIAAAFLMWRLRRRLQRWLECRRIVRSEVKRGIADFEVMLSEYARMPVRRHRYERRR